jgi:hypothetical protein
MWRYLFILIGMFCLAGCQSIEEQTIYSFQVPNRTTMNLYLGPWRTKEPILYRQDSNWVTYRVTTVLSHPEVFDRPYPRIRLPWVKLGNTITERAYAYYAAGADSIVLAMNAKTRLLYLDGILEGRRLGITAPLDSFFIWNGSQVQSVLYRNTSPCPAGVPCLRQMELSQEQGLVRLDIANLPSGDVTLSRP